MRTIMALVLSFACFSAVAEDAWNDHKVELEKATTAFIESNQAENEYKTWDEKIKARLSETSLQSLTLDWFCDNKEKLKEKDQAAIKEACFFFRKLTKIGEAPPWQIREKLTKEKIQEFLAILRERSANVVVRASRTPNG